MTFIHGNVPSSKNSKQWTGKFLINSKTVRNYLQKHEHQWGDEVWVKDRIPVPVIVGFHFVRDSHRKFDFHNAVQLCADLMVKHGWIDDDDMNHFIPVPFTIKGEWFSYNKEFPGVYIKIFEDLYELQ
jgi:hypothetical protein